MVNGMRAVNDTREVSTTIGQSGRSEWRAHRHPWTPLLDGPLASRAIKAIQAIGEALRVPPPPCLPGSDEDRAIEEASLAGGRAGLAILYAYLAQAGVRGPPPQASRRRPRIRSRVEKDRRLGRQTRRRLDVQVSGERSRPDGAAERAPPACSRATAALSRSSATAPAPLLLNTYGNTSDVQSQTLSDGRTLTYASAHDQRHRLVGLKLTLPNGYTVEWRRTSYGFSRSWPQAPRGTSSTAEAHR